MPIFEMFNMNVIRLKVHARNLHNKLQYKRHSYDRKVPLIQLNGTANNMRTNSGGINLLRYIATQH